MLLGYLFKPRAYSRALCAWYSGLSNDYRFIKISQSAREKYFSYCKKFYTELLDRTQRGTSVPDRFQILVLFLEWDV